MEIGTAKQIFDANKNNTAIEKIINTAMTFSLDTDEEGKKYIKDNFDKQDLVIDISETLYNILKVDADTFTEEIGAVVDEAAMLIIDDYYDSTKDAWQESELCNSDPYKYYGVRRSDF